VFVAVRAAECDEAIGSLAGVLEIAACDGFEGLLSDCHFLLHQPFHAAAVWWFVGRQCRECAGEAGDQQFPGIVVHR